jgi:methylsterol monooxygenase
MPFHQGQALFHDFHHESFNSCFGVLGVLDWYHETDVLFRKRYGLPNRAFAGWILKKE